MPRNYYVSGQYNYICDSCGQKLKSGVAKLRWDGFRVCGDCWESRHPQDFVKTRADNQSIPWSRPRSADVFVAMNWTAQPVEPITISEVIQTTADYYRYIGRIEYPEDLDLVNGTFINNLVLNSTSTDPAPPTNVEKVTLSESIVVSQGFNEAISDTITLSENISEVEGEFPGDSFGLTETVVYYTITNRLLNAHTLNEVLLG